MEYSYATIDIALNLQSNPCVMEYLLNFLPAVLNGIYLVVLVVVTAFLGYRLRYLYSDCSARNWLCCALAGAFAAVTALLMMSLITPEIHPAAMTVITLMAIPLGFLFKNTPRPSPL